ncbi:MAG: DoxX family protein [Nonlabens sp.]|uniref:DoxX family protein n=1 Tax=Nonlabens sp. TaxID=1888209 RepID=UPI003EF9EE0C
MKYLYWVATGLLCALMLWSASMYLMQYETVTGFFETFGFPTWIIYPLAFLKIAGVAMILWRGNRWLTEWAYAGFFFDMILALGAHLDAMDGGYIFTIAGIVLLFISYFTGNKVRKWKV